jgi:hypothetical protein
VMMIMLWGKGLGVRGFEDDDDDDDDDDDG